MDKILNNKFLIWGIVILCFGICFVPYFDLGNKVVRGHDNLDSYFVYYHVLAESNSTFVLDPMQPIDQVMNGLPRFCFPPPFNMTNIIYYLFGTEAGFVFNLMLSRLIGFLGMVLLLKKHLLQDNDVKLLVVLIALAFALLPFFSVWGLSLMGQPLLLYAILNIRRKEATKWDWIIILAIPFFSYFVFAGLFIIFLLAGWFVYDWIQKKHFQTKFFMAIAILGVLYLLIDYQLFYGMFFSGEFTPHRSGEFDPTLNFKGVIGVGLKALLNGWYHSANFFGLLLFSSGIFGIVIGFYQKKSVKTLILVGSLAIIFAGIFSILDWTGMKPIFKAFPIFVKFSLKRFHYLLPLTLFVFYTLGWKQIMKNRMGYYGAVLSSVLLLLMSFRMNSNFKNGGYNMDLLKDAKQGGLTYDQYLDPEVFQEIDEYIGKPQETYRVASLNISPSVAQYNGFYTLDSFQNLYRKEYNEQFNAINRAELDKLQMETIGNRCYLMSSELETGAQKVVDWDIDFEMLAEMGCEYIFSTIRIENSLLEYETSFDSNVSDRVVYLYKLKKSPLTSLNF